MRPTERSADLDIDPRSAGRARTIVKEALGTELNPETAMLLVSELVTNAIRHAHAVVRLRVSSLADKIRLEVSDDGGGTPVAQRANELDAHPADLGGIRRHL